ncbi:MAG TPA: ATP-binding protein [Sphingobium sp.]|uniref:ATP-binding protein n=1 Tax=Sphingobium sp. TaxID=1912891 RepID=UPI002ED13DA5
MKRWSLRARMLVMAAIATLAALSIAGWAMAGILERFVTQGVDQRLDAQLAVMASAVRDDGSIDRARLEQRLTVLGAGPEWRWRIAGPGAETGSADFPTLDPGPPHPPRPHDNFMEDPDRHGPTPLEGEDRQGRVHVRRVTIQSSAGPIELFAAAPARVIARPLEAALVPLLTVILILAGIFALAAFVQLRFGLRPVLALRDQVAGIRRGMREAVDEDQPAELRPLAIELNAMASDSASALSAARASAANLAHALKTPIATLALTTGNDPVASEQVKRIDGVIRHHLARARTAAIGRRATTLAAPVIADLAATIGALHSDVTISMNVPTDLAVAVDVHDLTEIIGNLLDNAARHARTTVAVTTEQKADQVVIAIDDDGPGIASEKRDAAMTSGVRLDESATGYGFGLAIVRELVALYGGSFELLASELNGLRAVVALPLAR